jgi:hypothetical protein
VIEKELGGTALFLNGAQGSVDVPAFRERDWDGMARKGTWLAREVLRVASEIRPNSDRLATERTILTVGARKVSRQYIAWCKKTLAAASDEPVNIRDGVDDTIYARFCMALLDSGVKQFDIEMTALLLADAVFVGVPFELFTEIGLEIKRRSPVARTYIADLTNGELGYVPTSRAIREGSYETRPGCAKLDEHADVAIIREALGLAGKLKAKLVE